jgi:hypothetical protein
VRVLFFPKWDGMIANKPRDPGVASASSGAERKMSLKAKTVTWASACILASAALAFSAIEVSAQSDADQKKYDDCVKKVKKAYRVPPGLKGIQDQKIKSQCGAAPKQA